MYNSRHSYCVWDGELFTSAVYKSFNSVAWSRIWNLVVLYICTGIMYLLLWAQYFFFCYFSLFVFCTLLRIKVYIFTQFTRYKNITIARVCASLWEHIRTSVQNSNAAENEYIPDSRVCVLYQSPLPNSGTAWLTTSCGLIRCRPFDTNWNIICSSSPTHMLYCDCCTTVLLWHS